MAKSRPESAIDNLFHPEWGWLYDSDTARTNLAKEIISAPQAYWDVKRCALVLDVAPGTVRQWARKGKIPAVRIGKAWRVRGTDLLEHIKDKWQSTNETPASIRIGGLDSGSVSKKLGALREQATKEKRKHSNTD